MTADDDIGKKIREASALYSDLAALQRAIEEAGVRGVELASSRSGFVLGGTVQTERERELAVGLARRSGKEVVDNLTVAATRERTEASDPELVAILADARRREETTATFDLYRKAIAIADKRYGKQKAPWRIALRLELESRLRGPLKYAEAAGVCRDALAVAEEIHGKDAPEVAPVAYAFAYCLHEGNGFHEEGGVSVASLYERAIALAADEKLRTQAEQMLKAWRDSEARRRSRAK